eukprot:5954007-Amphidinium_carterae.1
MLSCICMFSISHSWCDDHSCVSHSRNASCSDCENGFKVRAMPICSRFISPSCGAVDSPSSSRLKLYRLSG